MSSIYIIRGSHANEYELQNYTPLKEKYNISVITSHHPLTRITLPIIPLYSPTDLPTFPLRRQILNRLIGGEQWLIGLSQIVNSSDILHTAETYTPYTHQAVELRKHKKIKKLICTCWETIPHNNEKFSRLRNWKKDAYKYVDIFHTPTQLAKRALVKEGVNPDKIIVIPYGVDTRRFIPNKRNDNNLTVITAARRVEEKGYSLYPELKKSLNKMGIKYDWVYKKSYSQMTKIYSQADIFVLPSLTTNTWEEQYGMALIEAMSSGLAIVTTHSGAIPEVVGDAAIITNPNTKDILTAIIKLTRSKKTLYHYQQLSLKRSRTLDTRIVSQSLARLYL